MEANLARLAKHGAKIIRLDAFAYAIKKRDTDCFFVEPETWQLLAKCRSAVEKYGSDVLPEIHEHYSIQLKLASHSYPVYDFALPMLMLHALYFHQTQYLKNWFAICPRNQHTTLDTMMGLGSWMSTAYCLTKRSKQPRSISTTMGGQMSRESTIVKRTTTWIFIRSTAPITLPRGGRRPSISACQGSTVLQPWDSPPDLLRRNACREQRPGTA